MIKIFHLKESISSPFVDVFSQNYLAENGIEFTKNIFKADIIASISSGLKSYKWMKKFLFFKKFIVWTNEPRFDIVFNDFISRNSLIMNVYSGNVFFHNLHFLGSYHSNSTVDLGVNIETPPGEYMTLQKLENKRKFCVAVFSYRNAEISKLNYNGTDIDLFSKRQDLVKFMKKLDKVDIVGGNWPQDYPILESSGYENNEETWWNRKIEILQAYRYNICFENTVHPYYCTEKIWHAIVGNCLPVYYGAGTAIYETFPEESFIDASMFKSHTDLFYFLENLSNDEFIRRYNVCLDVLWLACAQKSRNKQFKTDIINKFIANVYSLVKRKR